MTSDPARRLAASLGADMVPDGQRRALGRYVAAVSAYALSEGLAFGLLVPVVVALLQHRAGTAAWWLLPLVAAATAGWLAHYDIGMRSLRLSAAWRRDLYARLGDQLMRLPIGWYDGPQAARLPQLVIGDVGRITQLVFLVQTLLSAVLTSLIIAVFLLAYEWRMGLAALLAVPVILLALMLGRRITERTEAAHHAATVEAGSRLVEFAQAQPTLRAAGQTEAGRRALDQALAEQHDAARSEITGSLPGQYLGRLGIQLAFTALLVTGLALATGHFLSAPRAIALVVLGISMLRPLEILVGAGSALSACQASLRRVRALLQTPPLPEPDASPAEPPTPSGAVIGGLDVELVDVHFAYPDRSPVLTGLNLTIPAGRTTALVGPSGAGKTTLTKLIARFHDVTAGSIRIGGVDVRDLSTRELLSLVSPVFQDVYLLDTTIEENIRLGNPDATAAEIREAARRARVDSILTRLPDGWDTQVGEGGRLLSGGERQRVAIARAFLKNAPIVLLDEATASLDIENEAAVRAGLDELTTGRTVLIIAHRLDTIARTDQIAVIDDGRIVESGRHTELLAADGRYAALWRERDRALGWRLESAKR